MTKSLAVLMIEDAETDAQLIARLLKKAGYTLTLQRVATADQIRAALAQATWQVVIADYHLPELDGPAALKLVQETGLDIPFIVVSGMLGEEAAVAMLRAGAHDYVMKDNLERLAPAIEHELSQAELRRERSQALEALRQSEEKFRHIFEYSLIGKAIILLPSGAITPNQALCDMLGYSKAELQKLTWQEITHPDDVASSQNQVNALLSGKKEAVRFHKRYIHKNGSMVWVDVGSFLRSDQKGTPLYLISSINNITQQKLAEEALQRSEAEYRTLAENSPDLIARLDRQLRLIYANPAAISAGQLQPKEYMGKTIAEVGTPEPAATQWHARFQGAIESGQQVEVVDKFPTPNSLRYMETRLLPEFAPDGSVQSLLVVARDITERKLAEEALQQYSTELEQRVAERTRELANAQEQLIRQEKLAALGQLAGGVGHELRQPLAIMLNAIYYLRLVQPDADECVQQYHGIIEQEALNAERIINDLLDFARLKSVAREPQAVAALVQYVLTRYPAPEAIVTAVEIPAGLPQIFADPHQIGQVVGNLVLNAYQAMPEGGKLTISAALKEDRMALVVQDTGTGISPEHIAKLFEPLFTTKAKGIGMGLTISKRLVEANGGQIEAQSVAGQGSAFTVYLPLDRSQK